VAGKDRERRQKVRVGHAGAASLEGERHPVVLRIPDDNRQEKQQRNGGAEVRPRRQYPAPLRRCRQQEQGSSGEQEHPVQLRQARKAAESARGEPPESRSRAGSEQNAGDAIGAGQHRCDERAVGKHEASRGPGEHRCQVERQRRQQARAAPKQQPPEREHQPGRRREQQDEGKAHRQGRLGAEQPGGAAG